jgi:uncharacterized membrane protein YtjA (UPF0391 family)
MAKVCRLAFAADGALLRRRSAAAGFQVHGIRFGQQCRSDREQPRDIVIGQWGTVPPPGPFAWFKPDTDRSGARIMLRWALFFFVLSLVAGLFGFTGIAVASASIARLLFFVVLVIFLVMLVMGLMAGETFL